MELMNNKLVNQVPKFDEDETPLREKIIHLHYFSPITNFDWFVYEYNPEEKLFFGFANLNDPEMAELGYFSLDEFEEINNSYGFDMIERDINFQKGSTQEISKRYPVLKKLL